MAADTWNRLRACTVGAGVSRRMASRRALSHTRATDRPPRSARVQPSTRYDGADEPDDVQAASEVTTTSAASSRLTAPPPPAAGWRPRRRGGRPHHQATG